MDDVKAPLVSCLCVTEGRSAFMPWLLWCFDRQRWSQRELVIIDSSLDPYLITDRDNVRAVTVSPGTGIAKKRNLALQEAKRELITWFDDDNWQHPDKLTWLSEALCAGASYDIRVLRKLIGEDNWGDTSEQLHALRERIGGESSQLIFSGSSEKHSIELKGGAREAVTHLAGGWRSISAYGQDGLLSVLMSAYRTGPWVRATVKSVLSQELPTGWELELIIAVDGCDEVLREVLKIEDARLVVLELAENGGTYRALNTALRYARGALIAILDSDDIAMPGRFRKQIEALQRHPEIALLGGQLMAINEKGELLPNKLCLSLDALSEFRRGGDWKNYLVAHGTWMVRRETYAYLGGYFDSRVGSDAEFCLRAVALGLHCRSLPDPLTQYRQRGGQLTRTLGTDFRSEVRFRMIEKTRRDAETYRQGETPRPIEPIGTSVRVAYRKGRLPLLVVMPTVPARQRTAHLVVQTLLQQQVDRIVVFLNGHTSDFSISDDPRVLQIHNPRGTGPIVRYREGALGHGVVLSVDDDLAYPPDYVEVVLHHLTTLGRGIAISQHAALWSSGDKSYAARSLLHYSGERQDFTECDYLGSGTAGFWGEDFESLRGEPPPLLANEDDIWMSAQLRARGIRLVRPPSRRNWIRPQPEACHATSLYNLAVKDSFKARDRAIAFAELEFGWRRGPGRPFLKRLQKDCPPASRPALQPAGQTVAQTVEETMDMRVFWLHRYKTVRGIRAVANRAFSVEQNERDYARCQEFMSRQLREDFGGKAPESLLDLGYGQGHYAQVASEIGVRRYVGLDFAAPRLAMPGDYHFLEQDVCEEGFNLGEKFDVVLLLDVAFHVIDDLAFERLLANVSRHAQGVVFVTGLFRDQRIAAHVLHRRLEHFQSLGIVTSIYPWRDILLARIKVKSLLSAELIREEGDIRQAIR
jgi:SAM-dependent methyltransferase